MALRLVLVDDQVLVRAALRGLLSAEPGLEVVGEAAEAREAFHLVNATHPDVVIVDLTLPGVNGVALTRELTRRDPECKVLVLSMHSNEDCVAQSLAAGAVGYALKYQTPREIIEAIRVVAQGDQYWSPRLSRAPIEEMLRQRGRRHSADGPCDTLSIREREIFDLLITGFSNGDIASSLCISIKTVETHRAHILKKLGAHSMVDLMRFASRHGLLHC